MKLIAVSLILSTLLAAPMHGQKTGVRMVVAGSQRYPDVSIDSLDGSDVFIRSAGQWVRVPIDSVAEIHTVRSGNFLKGFSIGLVAGGATGFLAGQIIDGAREKPSEPVLVYSGNGPPDVSGSTTPDKGTQFKIILPIVGGAVGATIGALVGSSDSDDVLNLTGRTTEEKRKVLVQFIQKK